jgi:ABC-type polysaccharide/polyol phosphate export permease
MPENSRQSKVEVVLAAMAVGVIGLSVLSMLATLLLVFFGVENLPAVMAQLPLIGLPVGFLLIIALLVAAIIRRSRDSRGN